jgi:hypothetical protein
MIAKVAFFVVTVGGASLVACSSSSRGGDAATCDAAADAADASCTGSGGSGGGDGGTGGDAQTIAIAFSCSFPPLHTCQDITASAITPADAQAIQDQCQSAPNGVLSMAACPTENRVGTCDLVMPVTASINPINGPGVKVTVHYYSPIWITAEVQDMCPSDVGTFTPN